MQRDLGSALILIRTGVGTGFIPCLHISHRQDKYTNDKYCESHLVMPGNVKGALWYLVTASRSKYR